MRLLAPASEDDMVATFLRGEIDSAQFAVAIACGLQREGLDRAVIDHADTRDAATNVARRRILSDYRHYPRGGVFTDLPDDTVWQWVSLTREELLEVRFINWSYWLDVTAGTRRPVDAIPRIGHGLRVLVGEITAGRLPPPLILVGRPGGRDLVVLEGHNRLTGMVMAAAHLPAGVTVLLGTAASMDK